MPPKRKATVAPEAPAPKRSLRRRDTDAQTERVLAEHFPQLSRVEQYEVKRDGVCLFDRLKTLKKEKKLVNGRLSATVRKSLQRQYAPHTSLMNVLVIDDPAEPVHQPLRVALQRMVSLNPASRTNAAILDWLGEERDANQKEIVGIFRALDELLPTQPASHNVFIKVAEYLSRKGYIGVYGKEISVMVPWFDAALASQYASCKKDRTEGSFLRTFQQPVSILPVSVHLNRLTVGGLTAPQRQESLTHCMGSQLGLKMFGGEAAKTNTQKFSMEVDAAVQKLLTLSKLTATTSRA